MDWQIIFWNVQITHMVMAVYPLTFAFHWGVTSSGWLSRGCDSPVLPNPPFSDNRKCLSHFSIQHITHFHQNVTNNINFKNCLNIALKHFWFYVTRECVVSEKNGKREKWGHETKNLALDANRGCCGSLSGHQAAPHFNVYIDAHVYFLLWWIIYENLNIYFFFPFFFLLQNSFCILVLFWTV